MTVDDDLDRALPRPAAPSTTQSHGTVMVALLAGFVLVAGLFWFSTRNVGPFTAEVTSVRANGQTYTVDYVIHNTGDKAGRGNCEAVARRLTGEQDRGYRFLSPKVGGGNEAAGSVTFQFAPGLRFVGILSC